MTDSLPEPEPEPRLRQCLTGLAGSPGIALAPAVVIGVTAPRYKKRQILDREVESELLRLQGATQRAKASLRRVMQRASHLGAELTILQAYVLMLSDPILADESERKIRVDRQCAEWAVAAAIHEMVTQVAVADDLYLRERGSDFKFVGDLIIRALKGEDQTHSFLKLDRPSVVVAHDLSPADAASMVRQPVVGLITEIGTRTSHTSIMARALEIPAVVGVTDAVARINTGDDLVVDGIRGQVVVWPSNEDVAEARECETRCMIRSRRLRDTRNIMPATACGVSVHVRANIELPGEALLAIDHGAQGIGLYRTEFLFVDRMVPPTEDEQFEVFRTVLQTVAPQPVVLRTFDFGGDKSAGGLEQRTDVNPALGIRAVRLALSNPEMFLVQLRAMIRASAFGDGRIMVPMIATLGELRQVQALFRRALEQVDSRDQPRAPPSR